MIGAILPGGRFKVLDLEGSVKVTIFNGDTVTLKPGQMVIVSADGATLGDVMNFNLGDLAARLQLVAGFSKPVSSWTLIEAAIQKQNAEIASGKLSNLIPFQESGFGLDTRYLGLNDPLFYTINPAGDGNPLNFPGIGEVGPMPGGPGGYQLLPPGFPPWSIIAIINPNPVTDVDPSAGLVP